MSDRQDNRTEGGSGWELPGPSDVSRLFSVFDAMPAFVYLRDADYRIRFANRGFVERFGPVEGRTCHEMLRGRGAPCEVCPADEVLASGTGRAGKQMFDEGRTYRLYDLPFTDTDGTPLVLRLGIDITAERDLEWAVAEAGNQERRRIANDLHEVLGQQLAGVAYMARNLAGRLQADGRDDDAGAAAEIADLLGESVRQTRGLARSLCPVNLTVEGLMTALRTHAEDVSELYACRCRFRCPRPVPVEEPGVATHLYHIAREAVAAAVHRGHAENVTIHLAGEGGGLRLEVADDGAETREPPPRGGMGRRIMAYRAAVIGGTLTVTSRPGEGTTVRCTLPAPGPQTEVAR